MRLKILIVDDEAHIRNGIAKMLKLDVLEAEITDLAGNAREAFDVVKKETPHIIITDIRMPDEDGLTLTKKVLEYAPKTRIVIVSGYDDFEYARIAMEMGVREYVLKPLDEEELNNILFRLKKDIEQEVIDWKNALKIKNKLFSGYNYARTKFLEKIVAGEEIDHKTLSEKETLFDINLTNGEFVKMLIYIDRLTEDAEKTWANEDDLLKFSIANIAEELITCCKNKISIYPNKNEILVLCSVDEDQKSVELHKYAVDIQNTVLELLKVELVISFSTQSVRFSEFSKIYSMLRIALLNKFTSHNKVFEASWLDSEVNGIHLAWEKKMEMYIGFNDLQKASELLGEIFGEEDKTVNFSAESLFLILHNVYNLLYKKNAIKSIGEGIRGVDPIGQVIESRSIEEVRDKIECDIYSTMEENNPIHDNENRMVIMLAKQYINQHYNDNISLVEVADYLNISPQYLSTLFKKYTGENFINYITDLRIENSKRLLEQANLRVYEIAYKVGYVDSKHYIKVFKKLNGVTPNEYREKYAAGIGMGGS